MKIQTWWFLFRQAFVDSMASDCNLGGVLKTFDVIHGKIADQWVYNQRITVNFNRRKWSKLIFLLVLDFKDFLFQFSKVFWAFRIYIFCVRYKVVVSRHGKAIDLLKKEFKYLPSFKRGRKNEFSGVYLTPKKPPYWYS